MPKPLLYRVLAIDNGSTTLGAAIVDIDITTGILHVIYNQTVHADRYVKPYQGVTDVDEARFARYEVMGDFITSLLDTYHPHHVAVESPFLYKQPQAFAVLKEMMLIIRMTVRNFDRILPYCEIPPDVAKKALGVRRKERGEKIDNKVLVTQALEARQDVRYHYPYPLDEHTRDAIAVACHIRDWICNQ